MTEWRFQNSDIEFERQYMFPKQINMNIAQILHWHSAVEFFQRLVVDGDGHLCVSVERELDVVTGPVLHGLLILTRQLQVLATPAGGRGWEGGVDDLLSQKVI